MLVTNLELQDMLKNPEKYFSSPEDVVMASRLSKDEKLKILKLWKHDQQELLVATEENMTDGEQDEGLFREIAKAISRLS